MESNPMTVMNAPSYVVTTENEPTMDSSEESGEESDVGSLVDFVVDDDAPDESVEVSGKKHWIDPSNIVEGKRQRKQTKHFEKEFFASKEVRSLLLADIPDDEIDAACAEEGSEDGDGEYVEEEMKRRRRRRRRGERRRP